MDRLIHSFAFREVLEHCTGKDSVDTIRCFMEHMSSNSLLRRPRCFNVLI